MAFWKESMINRLSNLINRNRSAAKISQVLCSTGNAGPERAHSWRLAGNKSPKCHLISSWFEKKTYKGYIYLQRSSSGQK